MPKGVYDRTTAKARPRINSDVRFWSKVEKQPNGCWLWMGGTDTAGYGQFKLSTRRTVKSHKYAYGDVVPEGLELNHKCRTKTCVNREHLEPVTHAANIEYRDHNPLRWYDQLNDTLPSCRNYS